MSRVTTELPQTAPRLTLGCHRLRDKAGRRRNEHDRVRPTARPGYVRACCEASLRGRWLHAYMTIRARAPTEPRQPKLMYRNYTERVFT
jgi:hypothetical protein